MQILIKIKILLTHWDHLHLRLEIFYNKAKSLRKIFQINVSQLGGELFWRKIILINLKMKCKRIQIKKQVK